MNEGAGFWMLLWKTLFIATLLTFSGMSVWVIVGGWIDIKHLFRDLSRQQEERSQKDGED